MTTVPDPLAAFTSNRKASIILHQLLAAVQNGDQETQQRLIAKAQQWLDERTQGQCQ